MKQFSLTQLKTQQLWYFLDVAETGSFTRAAERNYTSQANVSYAMRELEQTLDVQLFIRKNNELILTQYAKAFLPYVQNAFEQLQDGCRILREMNNPASGSVRIGYSFVFSLSLVPDLFRYLYRESEKAGIQLALHPIMAHVNNNLTSVEDMVMNGECDLGLTCVRVREGLDGIMLEDIEHKLLITNDHPLASSRRISLADVKDEPFILLNGDNETTGNWYLKLFDSQGITPNLLNTGMDWLSLLVEVSAGKCLTVAPDCNLDGYDISKIEIDHPGRFRDLYLIWPGKRKLSPAAEYCRQMIMDYYKVKKMQDK